MMFIINDRLCDTAKMCRLAMQWEWNQAAFRGRIDTPLDMMQSNLNREHLFSERSLLKLQSAYLLSEVYIACGRTVEDVMHTVGVIAAQQSASYLEVQAQAQSALRHCHELLQDMAKHSIIVSLTQLLKDSG